MTVTLLSPSRRHYQMGSWARHDLQKAAWNHSTPMALARQQEQNASPRWGRQDTSKSSCLADLVLSLSFSLCVAKNANHVSMQRLLCPHTNTHTNTCVRRMWLPSRAQESHSFGKVGLDVLPPTSKRERGCCSTLVVNHHGFLSRRQWISNQPPSLLFLLKNKALM